jgi:hypothetical protein
MSVPNNDRSNSKLSILENLHIRIGAMTADAGREIPRPSQLAAKFPIAAAVPDLLEGLHMDVTGFVIETAIIDHHISICQDGGAGPGGFASFAAHWVMGQLVEFP